MEDKLIADANNVTSDTFSHASNTQREDENAIFTSEKIDKSDKLVDAVNNLTIDDAKYYESNTANTSDTQGDLTRNPETVTYTSNGILNNVFELPDHNCLASDDKPGD